jgi:hypothetical protein
MTTKHLQQLPDDRKTGSSLVRRLVKAKDDPAKYRIRALLCDLDDEQLFRLGCSSQDIAELRGNSSPKHEIKRSANPKPRRVRPLSRMH